MNAELEDRVHELESLLQERERQLAKEREARKKAEAKVERLCERVDYLLNFMCAAQDAADAFPAALAKALALPQDEQIPPLAHMLQMVERLREKGGVVR